MDSIKRSIMDDLFSEDRALQNEAFIYILEATDKSVDWAYEVKGEKVKVKALELIATEGDLKYRKKYARV